MACVLDADDLLALLTACGAWVPDGARVVGITTTHYAGLEVTIEHPELPPLPAHTSPYRRHVDCLQLKETVMEKRGIIQYDVTPPEGEKKPEKQASAEKLEGHVTKRAADAAEAACQEDKGQEGKPCNPSG
jgi:hypothetical protein